MAHPAAPKKLLEFMLLSAVSAVTTSQRRLAAELGVSVATANLLVRRAMLAGLVRKVEKSQRQVRYELTGSGRARLAALARELLLEDTLLYRTLRDWLNEKVSRLQREKFNSVVLYGSGPLLELSLVSLLGSIPVLGTLPEARCGLPAYDITGHTRPGAVISVTNEVPAELRRTLRESDIPLVYFT
jgi:DNA-binding MarR family transcriptional regulator